MDKYINELKIRLKGKENKEEAEKIKNYMKQQYDCYGLRAPQMKEVFKTHIEENGLPNEKDLKVMIKALYEKKEREYQMFAISIVDKTIVNFKKEDLEILEYMIVNKSWWDTIDHIAINQVSKYFKKFPEQINSTIEKWIESENIWLIRTAILFQLKDKEQTNETLLYDIIEKTKHTKEFFINKAIGWVLREYAKTNKKSVLKFVNSRELSSLSKREALKHIKKEEN